MRYLTFILTLFVVADSLAVQSQSDTTVQLKDGARLRISQEEVLRPEGNHHRLLYNSKGVRVGTYNVGLDSLTYGEVSIGSKIFRTSPLNNAMLLADDLSILMYGAPWHQCLPVPSSTEIKTKEGETIKDLSLVSKSDIFLITSTSHGHIFYTGANEQGDSITITKTNFNGNAEWVTTLPSCTPVAITCSPSEDYVVLSAMVYDTSAGRLHRSMDLIVLGKEGAIQKHLHGLSHIIPVYSMRIASDRYLIVCSKWEWKTYDMHDDFKLMASGVLPTMVLSNEHMEVFEKQNLALVVGNNHETNCETSLILFNFLTGEQALKYSNKTESTYYFKLASVSDSIKRIYTRDASYLLTLEN
jgi:hypothetical protein